MPPSTTWGKFVSRARAWNLKWGGIVGCALFVGFVQYVRSCFNSLRQYFQVCTIPARVRIYIIFIRINVQGTIPQPSACISPSLLALASSNIKHTHATSLKVDLAMATNAVFVQPCHSRGAHG